MKEWLEVIRDPNYFNLMVLNTDSINSSDKFSIDTYTGPIVIEHEETRTIKDTSMANAPNFIMVSDAHSHATTDSDPFDLIPHDVATAPAQRAGNIAFIWGHRFGGTLYPHRDDGFPAVIIAVGISKYYQYGNLSRKKQYPAIKAEHLAAMWYGKRDEGLYRNNGPTSVCFDNYKEFWVDGEFKGHRWTSSQLGWSHRTRHTELGNFLNTIKGTTNLFTEAYFMDAADEVCFITDFS